MSPAAKRPATPSKRRWSQGVTEHSDALDLRAGVFKERDPKKIAASLKRSAERSDRRKSNPFRSAMSMISFFLNRAGSQLPAAQRRRIETAKSELRKLFGRTETQPGATRPPARRARPRRAAPKAGA